jgi:hypothetical protein
MKTGQKSDLLGDNRRYQDFRAVFIFPFLRMQPPGDIDQSVDAQILNTGLRQ